jgi:hypothetical protein
MSLFDRNNIPPTERIAICYARGMALAVFDWIRSYCVIKDQHGDIVNDLPSKHVVQILNSLLEYKATAVHEKYHGAPHCNATMLKAQVQNVVTCDKAIEKLWKERNRFPSDTLAIPLEGFKVEWKADCGIQAGELI